MGISNIKTREQELLSSFFNGERTFGTGTCLPKKLDTLTSGNGLIKNGDFMKETASMFGI